jgi:hypothetical protein
LTKLYAAIDNGAVVRRFALLLGLSTALAVVAAGCGNDESAEEKWAGSVCSEVSDWKGQIQQSADDVQEQLQSPDVGTLAAVDAEVREAVDATGELASDLQALDPPDTEAGTEAKQEVDAFATQLETTTANAKQTVEGVPEGADAAQIAQALAPLVPSLQSLAVKASSMLAAVQESGEELKQGFEDADSCDEFR